MNQNNRSRNIHASTRCIVARRGEVLARNVEDEVKPYFEMSQECDEMTGELVPELHDIGELTDNNSEVSRRAITGIFSMGSRRESEEAIA